MVYFKLDLDGDIGDVQNISVPSVTNVEIFKRYVVDVSAIAGALPTDIHITFEDTVLTDDDELPDTDAHNPMVVSTAVRGNVMMMR